MWILDEIFYCCSVAAIIYPSILLGYIVCFQEAEMPLIPHSELKDLEEIGRGGFSVAYQANHERLGTVVYKELDVKILDDEYEICCTVTYSMNFDIGNTTCISLIR